MKAQKRAAIVTLGCKVNWYDSKAMEEALAAAGFELAGEGESADVYIVNTCAVTVEAERKSRQTLRRLIRANPDARVIAAGCYAQRDPHGVADIEGLAGASGTGSRASVVGLALGETDSTEELPLAREYEDIGAAGQQGHTRAVLKIEDGCNAFCAYCVIPSVRGIPRSRPVESIAREARELAARGFREIVLVGINLSKYDGGTGGAATLADAVEAAAVPGVARVRLGSLEPDVIDETLLARLAAVPQFCPHFHLSLQSGCTETLRRMGRRYTGEDYLRKLEMIRRAFPDAGITTDVIVGFPGETAEEFAESVAFVAEAGFQRVHVFPYSRRTGTRAADMSGQVARVVKEARAAAMQAASAQAGLVFRKAMVGRVADVLFEDAAEDGRMRGYTANYVQVTAPVGSDAAGQILPVQLTDIEDEEMTGQPV